MDNSPPRLVTIFGGSGFAGSLVVQRLARAGFRIRVAVRRPDLAGHVRMYGTVGQVEPIQANVRFPQSVAQAVNGAEIVINLAGIDHERGRQRFGAVNAIGAGAVAEAACRAGVSRLVHASILGADLASRSANSRSRAQGDQAVLSAFPGALVLRGGLPFGQGDWFFNTFGALARLFPALPLVGGKTRLQPLYVGDFAAAIASAATGAGTPGTIYELGGPDSDSVRGMVNRLLTITGRTNWLIPIPAPMARFGAFFTQMLPNPIMTVDRVAQLGEPALVSDEALQEGRTLAAFGITGTTMDAVLPTYLWRFRPKGQYDTSGLTNP